MTVEVGGGDAGGNLQIEAVSHAYATVKVLDNVSMEIGSGEFVTLLGASGSGKTTLLRIIGGLIQPGTGRIRVAGRDITRLPPEKRDIGFVFQNYALFPHLTVAENIGFPLKVRGLPKRDIDRQVQEALGTVGLAGLGRRHPAQLSGGQQQRVALARAIVFRPRVLLLDEPLGALDRQLRQQLGLELRSLQRRSGITMVYVTHDQEEAFTMSTQVAVMNQGRVLQIGAPQEIYRRPADLFVARFVGELNSFEGIVLDSAGGRATVRLAEGIEVDAVAAAPLAVSARVVCTVRPEHVRVDSAANGTEPTLQLRVGTVIFGGSWHRLELLLPGSGRVVKAEGRGEPAGIVEGGMVTARFEPGSIIAFPSAPSVQA